MAVPVPDGIPDETAAQLLAMPLSAIALFDDLHVAAGDWMAQNAANGAVGRTLTAVARVVDSVCDANSLELNGLLGPGGEDVVFGALARQALCLNPGALIFAQTRVRGFWMNAWMVEAGAEAKRSAIERCMRMALAGELHLPVAATYAFAGAAEALRAAERPRNGKIMFSASGLHRA